MDDRKDITVPMDASLNDAIEAELGYGDSKAGWIRDAIKMRLARDRDEPVVTTDADSDETPEWLPDDHTKVSPPDG